MENPRTIGKVTQSSSAGGGLAGAITLIVVWILTSRGVDIPPEVAAGFTVIISFIGGLIGGWLVKPGEGEHRG